MGNKKPKVLVALTAQRMIFARTAFCLIQAALNADDYEFYIQMEMGADIASSRNRLAQAALDQKADYLLFIDYDMYFPPRTISTLLSRKKDVIGATYNFRQDPPKSTAIPLEGTEAKTDEPFKVECMGAGMLLIKTEVFNKFPKPWFMWGYTPEGTLLYGEDTYFCQMAKNQGSVDVWADPTLGVKHIGEQLF